jgi:hypothetical protein
MLSKVKLVRSTLAICLALSLSVNAANAASAISGKQCQKIDQTIISQDKKFTCVKSGKKLMWNKGVAVIAKAPYTITGAKPYVSAESECCLLVLE